MTSKDILKNIITDSQNQVLPNIWKRIQTIPIDNQKIITLTGVRRSGKTYHLFNLINQLKASGIPNQQILYINFEDERLHLNSDSLDQILQSYQELYPSQKLSDCYFFFDEIQEINGWYKFINRLYSSISQHIFITGSNAKLLSAEIATSLRGRTITFEIYPLSFSEFANTLSPNLNPHSSTDRSKIINMFNLFLTQGGFPELINQTDDLKNKVLQEYFDVMVFRDLIERYRISNPAVLKYFCKRVVGASGGEFSVNKIYNELKSQGYQIGKETLYNYANYVESIYLNRFISKYSHSIVKTEASFKKTYVIDQGLGCAIDYKFSQDKGRLLETTVALELLKQNKQICYQQNNNECDFVIIEKGTVTEAIQVAIDISDQKTLNREINGLIETCIKFSLTKGTIITLNHDEKTKQNNIDITIVSAWKYFFNV